MLTADVKADTHNLVWTTTGQPASYTKWYDGEPNPDFLDAWELMCMMTDRIAWSTNECDYRSTTVCEYSGASVNGKRV
jgi:hypothetical protein